ncbi:hypothetical protein BsWGS_00604 [Bradybaena similaris]
MGPSSRVSMQNDLLPNRLFPDLTTGLRNSEGALGVPKPRHRCRQLNVKLTIRSQTANISCSLSLPAQALSLPAQGLLLAVQGLSLPVQGLSLPVQGLSLPVQGFSLPVQGLSLHV